MERQHLATAVGLTVLLILGFSFFIVRQNMKSESRNYMGHSTDICDRLKFTCPLGYQYFNDDEGCGCEVKSDKPMMDPQKNATECTLESRQYDICAEVYAPVCGWFDPAIVQCIKYPCASTYGNSCQACQNANVKEYTQGTCPSS